MLNATYQQHPIAQIFIITMLMQIGITNQMSTIIKFDIEFLGVHPGYTKIILIP